MTHSVGAFVCRECAGWWALMGGHSVGQGCQALLRGGWTRTTETLQENMARAYAFRPGKELHYAPDRVPAYAPWTLHIIKHLRLFKEKKAGCNGNLQLAICR